MKTDNVEEIKHFYDDIKNNAFLCQPCGICVSMCKVDALKIKQNEFKQFIPVLDSSKCVGCKQCVNSCNARKNVDEKQSVVGPYRRILIAKSTNNYENVEGSSGGVVTALLRFGLEKGYFQEFLSVDYSTSKTVAHPKYFKDATNQSGSKYISAPVCTIYDKKKKNLAATVLPCQAKAIRKQSEDTFLFGLFCSKLSTEDLLLYMKKKSGFKENIEEVSFRRGIWPGMFTIKGKNDKCSYRLNRSEFGAAYNSYYFAASGCLMCDDYFAQKADLSFGDPWGKKQYKEGYYGETVVIVRSKRGEELISDAIKSGVILGSQYNLEELVSGHIKEIYNKKTALIQRLKFVKQYTDEMNSYDESTLIKTHSANHLNKFSIRNNLKIRKSGKYFKVQRKSIKKLYIVRFTHAFFLSKYLKKNHHKDVYLEIAKKEKVNNIMNEK